MPLLTIVLVITFAVHSGGGQHRVGGAVGVRARRLARAVAAERSRMRRSLTRVSGWRGWGWSRWRLEFCWASDFSQSCGRWVKTATWPCLAEYPSDAGGSRRRRLRSTTFA